MTEIELAKICYALIKIFGKKEGKKLVIADAEKQVRLNQ